MSFRKNVAAIGDYVRTQGKIRKLKGQIADRQRTVRAMRGGQVGGLSSGAASRIASQGSMFDGGATPRKKGGGSYR